MSFGVIWILAAFFFVDLHKDAFAIDDKLDFGGRTPSHSSFISDRTVQTSSFIPATYSSSFKKLENNDDFDKIGIVCTDGGCNTTKSSDSEDTVKADVVVHIETKVDLTRNKSKPIDDTPDIPIVIGTDDSNPNRNDYNGFKTEPKSIYIPGSEPNFYPNSGLGVNTNTYGQSYPSSMSGNSVYSSRRVDSANPFQGNGFDIDSGVNINIKTLPPLDLDIVDPNRNMLNTNDKPNGIELTVPYFEPSLHNHYYGETPPPQVAFYPRRTSIMNPVEFRVMRPSWGPSKWQNQFGSHRHSVTPSLMGQGMQCPCQNGQATTDLHWYPNSNRRSSVSYPGTRSSINDPGSQINDKLAPLN